MEEERRGEEGRRKKKGEKGILSCFPTSSFSSSTRSSAFVATCREECQKRGKKGKRNGGEKRKGTPVPLFHYRTSFTSSSGAGRDGQKKGGEEKGGRRQVLNPSSHTSFRRETNVRCRPLSGSRVTRWEEKRGEGGERERERENRPRPLLSRHRPRPDWLKGPNKEGKKRQPFLSFYLL